MEKEERQQLLDEFRDSPLDAQEFLRSRTGLTPESQCLVLLDELRRNDRSELPSRLEQYLTNVTAVSMHPLLRMILVSGEIENRLRAGDATSINEYQQLLLQPFSDQTRIDETASRDFAATRVANPTLNDVDATVKHERNTVAEPISEEAKRFLMDAPRVRGFEPGDRFGDYEIVNEIARGGMGVVFKARQISLNRMVALKMILSSHLAREKDVKRFRAEAEAAAKLEHLGIVPIFEVGEQEGQVFFSMGLVEGGSLEDIANPMPSCKAAELVRRLAEATQFAHSQNIVHRDIKPANVLLDDEGKPKLTDFGLAKQLDSENKLTKTGTVMGTPAYMSPEQASGRTDLVGPLSDVYSLGAVLYFLTTGQQPFRGGTALETLRLVMTKDPVSPHKLNSNVDSDLSHICLKCMEKSPSRRYTSAGELCQDLERYLRHEPISAVSIGGFGRLSRWTRRNPIVASLTASVLLLLVVGLSVSSFLAVLASSRADDLNTANNRLNDQNLALAQANEEVESKSTELEEALDDAKSAEQAALRSATEAKDSNSDLEAFREFLISDLLASARPYGQENGMGANVTLREALLKSAYLVDQRFQGRPLAEALTRHDLGVTLRFVGETDIARAQLERAYELRREHLGPTHSDTLDTQNSYAVSAYDAGDYELARDLFQDLVESLSKTVSPDDELLATARTNLAFQHQALGQTQQAIVQLEQVVTIAKGFSLWFCKATLSDLYFESGEQNKAIKMSQDLYKELLSEVGPYDSQTVEVESMLADQFETVGELDRALELRRKNVPKTIDALGVHHVNTRNRMRALCCLLLRFESHSEARQIVDSLVSIATAQENRDVSLFLQLQEIAAVYAEIGNLDETRELFTTVYNGYRERLGASHDQTIEQALTLARVTIDSSQHEQAIQLLENTLSEISDPDSHRRNEIGLLLAFIYEFENQPSKAETIRRAFVDKQLSIGAASDQLSRARPLLFLALNLLDQQHFDEARSYLDQFIEMHDMIDPQVFEDRLVRVAEAQIAASNDPSEDSKRRLESTANELFDAIATLDYMQRQTAYQRLEFVPAFYQMLNESDKASEWMERLASLPGFPAQVE